MQQWFDEAGAFRSEGVQLGLIASRKAGLDAGLNAGPCFIIALLSERVRNERDEQQCQRPVSGGHLVVKWETW